MSDGEEPTTPEGEGSACQTIGVSEDQPPLKRRKENFCPMKKSDLETRLLRVLSCSVCLDLPSGAIYQVRFSPFFHLGHDSRPSPPLASQLATIVLVILFCGFQEFVFSSGLDCWEILIVD